MLKEDSFVERFMWKIHGGKKQNLKKFMDFSLLKVL